MNTTTTTRRAVLAGAASLSALAIPALAAPPSTPDPIFAAIERHRQSALEFYRQVAIEAELDEIIPFEKRKNYHVEDRDNPDVGRDDDPRWTAFRKTYDIASDEKESSAIELTDTVPTTMAGVVALLAYLDSFARGAVRVSETNYSSYLHLPDDLFDESVVDHRGRPVELPFSWWIMRNVQTALVRLNSSTEAGSVMGLMPQAQPRRVAGTGSEPDRLLDLIRRYEAQTTAFDVEAMSLPSEQWDARANETFFATKNQIIMEQPPATSAAGAIAALSHLLNDDTLAGREESQGEMFEWLLIRAARDYIAAAASKGDIAKNVAMLPLFRAAG